MFGWRQLLTQLFSYSLVLYLGLFLLENIFPGFVSEVFSVNFLLLPVLVLGVATAIWPLPEELESVVSAPKASDFWLALGLSLLGGWLIYSKIDLAWPLRQLIAGLSGLLILLMSVLVILPEEADWSQFSWSKLGWGRRKLPKLKLNHRQVLTHLAKPVVVIHKSKWQEHRWRYILAGILLLPMGFSFLNLMGAIWPVVILALVLLSQLIKLRNRYFWATLLLILIMLLTVELFQISLPSFDLSALLPQSQTVVRLEPAAYSLTLANQSGRPEYTQSYQQLLKNNGYTKLVIAPAETYPPASLTLVMFAKADIVAGNEVAALLRQSYGQVQTVPLAANSDHKIIVILTGATQ